MLWRKLRRNKKGITLVEMVVAIAVTAILATTLSAMIVPIVNVYSTNSNSVELANAVTARLNDFALHLRPAKEIYLLTETGKFPVANKDDARYTIMREHDLQFGFAMDDYYARNKYKYDDGTEAKIPGYLFPELKGVDWSNVNKPKQKYGSDFGLKLASDDYQSPYVWCAAATDLLFYVRSSTSLEIRFTMKKGSTTYTGTKLINCENLIVDGKVIKTIEKDTNKVKDAKVTSGTNENKWTKYYSVWFARFS